MLIKTSKLKKAQLDWVVAQIDPQCAGLTWGTVEIAGVGSVFCGMAENGTNEFVPAIFVGNYGFMPELKIKHQTQAEYYGPTTNWQQAGRFIEKEGIAINPVSRKGEEILEWEAKLGFAKLSETSKTVYFNQEGKSALEAALRCLVASKLGEEVEVPDCLTAC